MTARQVAHILSDIETLLQLQGENDFKSRAYGRAARALETSSIATVEESNRVDWSAVPGIGKSLAAEILEIVGTGTCRQLEALRAATPPGLLEILEVPRLGAKKVRALYMQLGITSLGELEYAARENRIVTLPGFGAKSQENILAGIEEVKRSRGKFRIDAGLREAERLVPLLGALPSARRAALAGRLRRGGEEFSSISFVVETDVPDVLVRELSTVEGLDGIELHGRAIHALADERFAVVIHTAEPGNFFATLHHRTGAVDYEFMISIPLSDRGYDLRGDGLFRDGRRIELESEEELFEHAGMQFIPPELREGIDEVRRAIDGELPELVTMDDLRGVMHVHSVWSDGRNTLPELVEHARSLGYRYLLICDHSKAAFYANGLDERRLEAQGKEIDEINARYDPAEFRLLKGIECDILADGRMDLEADALMSLDAVVASIHSSFQLPEEAQTERLLAALEHPAVTILGHPTGRLILGRRGYEVNLRRVIDRAAELGKSIELNANPHRLDLSWRMVRHARRRGMKVAINPDAHSLEDFSNVRYGVILGRKGWLTRKDVLNAMDAEEVLAFAARARQGAVA